MRHSSLPIIALSLVSACTPGAIASTGAVPASRLSAEAQLESAEPQWAPKYTQPGTFGKALEDHFSAVFGPCNITGVKHNNQVRSSIPLTLQQQFRDSMQVRVRTQDASSASRMFAYVFPSRQAAYELEMGDQRRVLPADLVSDSLEIVPFGTSRIVHLHSCRTILAAAAKADAGVNLPVADLRAALRAEAEGGTTTRIGLVHGLNMSSLADAIERSAAPSERRLAARLYAWLWWADNPTAITQEQFYVQSFEGASMYLVSTRDQSATAGVDISGGAAAPGVASIRASLNAVYDRDDRTEVQRVGTIHWLAANGNPKMIVNPLPTPASIQNHINTSVRLVPVTPLPDEITGVRDYQYVVEIRGVPEPLCRSRGWVIEKHADSRVNFSEPSVSFQAGACRFGISFSPIQPIPQDGVRLAYSLLTTQTFHGEPLRVPGPDVVIATLGSPVLDLQAYNEDWTVTSGVLAWDVPFRVQDPSGVVSWNQDVQILNPELRCGQERMRLSGGNTAQKDQANSIVRVPIRRQFFPADNLAVDDHTKWRNCEYTATLRFGSRNMGTGSIRVRHPELLPAEAAPSAVVPAPDSSPNPTPDES